MSCCICFLNSSSSFVCFLSISYLFICIILFCSFCSCFSRINFKCICTIFIIQLFVFKNNIFFFCGQFFTFSKFVNYFFVVYIIIRTCFVCFLHIFICFIKTIFCRCSFSFRFELDFIETFMLFCVFCFV